MFTFRNRSLIGLDIDTVAVRMVQLRHNDDGYTVLGACVNEIVPWGDDPELRRIHTARAIRQGLARRNIDGKLAVCGLRGPEVVVRGFEFPALPPEEIEGAVRLEASQICPFNTEESTLDYQVTSTDVRETRGFWVAANNSLIRNTRHLVHEAGLRCALIDVDGLALLNCLRGTAGGHEDKGRVAILDVGGACATVAVMDHAGRPFVRDIASGSQQILRRIAVEARVPLEIAKGALLRCETGYGDADVQDTEFQTAQWRDDARLYDGLEGACNELLQDVATTLRYYAAQYGCARVERLLVCGEFSAIEAFIELLQTELYIDVTPWNPIATMRCEAGEECLSLVQEAGPSMALAAGLAMRRM